MGMFAGSCLITPVGEYATGEHAYRHEPGKPPLSYYSDNGLTVELPDSYQIELSTTPRHVWVLPHLPKAQYNKAAVVHDFLYERHQQGRDFLGFSESNALLEEMLRAEGVARWTAWACRVACNLGGLTIWNRAKYRVQNFQPLTFSRSFWERFVPYLEHERWQELEEMIGKIPIRHLTATEQVTLSSLLCHDEILCHLPRIAKALGMLTPPAIKTAELTPDATWGAVPEIYEEKE